MKRYDVHYNGEYEYCVESIEGGWIPADVGQSLYDALKRLRAVSGKATAQPEIVSEMVSCLVEADAILSVADKGER